MKTIYRIYLHKVWFTALLLTLSCHDKFLDQQPLGLLTEGSFMVSESDAILATNAAYNTLREWHFHHGGFPFLDMMSDESVKGSNPSDGSRIKQFQNFSYSPGIEEINNWYAMLYKAIRRANVVIVKVPSIVMDEELKAKLIGEARFLRAYFYFDLVRAFGDVPLITTLTPNAETIRTATEIIYAELIIPDLKYAESVLPVNSEYELKDAGRATKGVAQGLLSKVYLFLDNFPEAETYALKVINSGEYFLDSDFENVFSVFGEFGSGSMFEVGSTREFFTQGGHQYGETQGVRGTPNRGWGFNRPSWKLINDFEPGDPRRDASIIFLNETLDGITILGDVSTPDTTYDATNQIIEIETYNQKAYTPGTTTLDSWQYNIRLLRYADILLVAAEASAMNGKISQALQYVNTVRARARGGNTGILPDLTEGNPSTLRDLILDERHYELALESHRFFDLVRTNKASEVLGDAGFIVNKHELLPIPQAEIDLSQGKITQNPNW